MLFIETGVQEEVVQVVGCGNMVLGICLKATRGDTEGGSWMYSREVRAGERGSHQPPGEKSGLMHGELT